MVSRRNFLSSCAMMAILLFMFQFLQVFKDSGNVYDTNEAVTETVLSGEAKWEQGAHSVLEIATKNRAYVLFIGDTESDTANVVRQWCTYTKRLLLPRSEATGKMSAKSHLPDMVIVQGSKMNFDEDLDFFAEMAELGVPIVFCGLPEPSVIGKNMELQDLLGVKSVAATNTRVKSIQLFSGFLFGGDTLYEEPEEPDEDFVWDLSMEFPWYVTGKGTKTYMVGIPDDELLDSENYPAIIWRNTYKESFVFSINSDYVAEWMGMGLLNGCEHAANDYLIYPVVNARNTLLANSPAMAEENTDKLLELYSRESSGVLRDVMWPGIAAMTNATKVKLTCFVMPQYDYQDAVEPDGEDMVYYLQQMKEMGAEAGRSLTYKEGITLQEKLEQDEIFWESLNSHYSYRAFFAREGMTAEVEEALKQGRLGEVQTISGMEEDAPIVSYYNEGITFQSILGDAREYSPKQQLQLNSLMTAMGYSNVLIDMQSVMWSETEEDRWENFFETISSNVTTYWSDWEPFAATTLTESDARVRSFLNLDYTQQRKDNTIELKVNGYGEEAWFVLRTHGEKIVRAVGAEYEKIEEDAFLIRVLEPAVWLELGKAEEQLDFFFENPFQK